MKDARRVAAEALMRQEKNGSAIVDMSLFHSSMVPIPVCMDLYTYIWLMTYQPSSSVFQLILVLLSRLLIHTQFLIALVRATYNILDSSAICSLTSSISS